VVRVKSHVGFPVAGVPLSAGKILFTLGLMETYRLRELMEDWGRKNGRRLSLKELAERTGINRPVLSRMTDPRGYTTNTRFIEVICRFFGVEASDLIVFAPPINPDGEETKVAPPTPRERGSSKVVKRRSKRV
jgi:putative transcriptional regulator